MVGQKTADLYCFSTDWHNYLHRLVRGKCNNNKSRLIE